MDKHIQKLIAKMALSSRTVVLIMMLTFLIVVMMSAIARNTAVFAVLTTGFDSGFDGSYSFNASDFDTDSEDFAFNGHTF
jgi:hypothetical protein